LDDILLKVMPVNKSIKVPKGSYLIDILYENGFIIPSSCGKRGICGKCLVKVEFEDEKKESFYINSCQFKVEKNVIVHLPQIYIEKQTEIYKYEKPYQIKIVTRNNPNVKVIKLDIGKNSIGNSRSYLDYFFSKISEKDVSITILEKIANIKKDISKSYVLVYNEKKILDIKKEKDFFGIYGLSIDLGTTSIGIELIDLISGKTIGEISELNPQVLYGDDVISRISYAVQSEEKLILLQKRVISVINNLISQLTKTAGITENDIYDIVVAGNTTMLHLFLGICPLSLGEYPFIPVFIKSLSIPSKKINLSTHSEAEVYIFPAIGGFVGGDVTAGLLSLDNLQRESSFLFIDLGTNGEIVISNNGKLWATSTAVGPAFEGGRIQCGMRASLGAIEKVSYRNGDIDIKVIGDKEPLGICGSGLIDLLSVLLRLGVIDITGRMLLPKDIQKNIHEKIKNRLETYNNDVIFKVFEGTQKKVFLSARDVRQLQLSCSAIKCGIKLLAEKAGVHFNELQKIYIAGTFGFYLDKANLKTIGIIPEEVEEEKICFIGNSSLAGAKCALLDKDLRVKVEKMSEKIKHIDLSTIPGFEEEFAMSTFFPEVKN